MRLLLSHAIAALIVGTSIAGAQTAGTVGMIDSIRVAIENANELADVPALENTIATTERAIAGSASDSAAASLLRHYHAYALYRAGTLVLGRDGSGKARPYFDRAAEELESLTKGKTIPESFALLSAVYGMQIASAKIQMIAGMKLGPKSSSMSAKAMELAPKNPRVYLIRGIGAFNTPSAVGGGMDKAETDLKKAIELFASDNPAPPLPKWGLADAHIWLGRVYVNRHQTDSARAEYQAALTIQPRNAWVITTLLPALQKP
jgi:tetratricopeptide (TPR) repeat protein